MAELVLEGCRVTPLSGYLSALGAHRAIHRLLDFSTEGFWRDGRYVLVSSSPTVQTLSATLSKMFEPGLIVSPWNAGSGFNVKGTKKEAIDALNRVRASPDPRLHRLKASILAADAIIEMYQCRVGGELWQHLDKDKALKRQFILDCRNRMPDDAVAWIDASIALAGIDRVSPARILGTGGNLGNQELSSNYVQRCLDVLCDDRSELWLESVLDGVDRAPLMNVSGGQYDPQGLKAPEEAHLVTNPWRFVLLIEGALLFATAVVRRHGADYADAAVPFQVGSSTGGLQTATAEEVLAELWVPEWSTPMRITEIAHLLGEGRADWNGATARSGLDMARAAATFGVDRGISRFHRYVIANRHGGKQPIAVSAGRIEVGVRGGVDLLAPLDRWREALRRSDPSSHIAARLRALDQTIFDHACAGAPAALVEVFAALGRCRSAASRSGKVREAKLPSLSIPHGANLFEQFGDAVDDHRELRIALALATSRDETKTFGTWLGDPLLAGRLVSGLADIARRRGFPLATHETVTDREPSVRGARIAFERGMRLRSGDVQAFVEGATDDELIAALTLGLSCVDWQYTGNKNLPGTASQHHPALDLLLLFTGAEPLEYTNADGELRSLFVRPGHDWPSGLIAGHVRAVLQDAARRLHIAGLRHVVAVHGSSHDGRRLAAALLLTTKTSDRRAALSRVAVVGSTRIEQLQEVTT
jgi:CRISPR-associated protein Csx17